MAYPFTGYFVVNFSAIPAAAANFTGFKALLKTSMKFLSERHLHRVRADLRAQTSERPELSNQSTMIALNFR